MSVRTEQTLRRMWDESLKLAADSSRLTEDADESAVNAEAAEKAARAHRLAEESTRNVGAAMGAEAADLADLVNRERQDAGLSPLAPGDPYPADPAPVEQPTPDDTLVASVQSAGAS